jgi:hypothetical protein
VNFFPLGVANKDFKWTTDIGFAFTPDRRLQLERRELAA